MKITVNGREREVADGLTLAQLLSEMKMDARSLAVERNQIIAEREDFEATVLEDGDRLEIVQFVGGG
ncbi:MAG: sulfur carrier protein ThiS [Geoalkalibacter sp.]|jgi:thiamine biosynthesis protein ThiS|uniref:sulfur carrier protein ThiS n=1 Tax=Geoalkalibacter sp. TaxID=3041440 RepID=UPI002A971A55|nr:sulfur carrier protein ThiS [Thermodesulfobacteriota bacterium]